jgi:hypothetical protein
MVGGSSLFLTLGPQTSQSRQIGYLILLGAGSSTTKLVYSTLNGGTFNSKEQRKIRVYAAVYETLTCAFASSIAQAIFSNVLIKSSNQSSSQLFTRNWHIQAEKNGTTGASEAEPTSAYSQALQSTFILPMSFSALSFLLSLQLPYINSKIAITSVGDAPVFAYDNRPFVNVVPV